MKVLVYHEPTEDGGEVTIKRTKEEAIEWMRDYTFRHHGVEYPNPEEAFLDYVALHWAYWKDE